MQHASLCFAAAALLAMNATQAAAQGIPPERANDLLSLEQRQIVAEIRERDRDRYLYAAKVVSEMNSRNVSHIKPLARWTQFDFQIFREEYDTSLLKNPDDALHNVETIRGQRFFRNLTTNGSSSDSEHD